MFSYFDQNYILAMHFGNDCTQEISSKSCHPEKLITILRTDRWLCQSSYCHTCLGNALDQLVGPIKICIAYCENIFVSIIVNLAVSELNWRDVSSTNAHGLAIKFYFCFCLAYKETTIHSSGTFMKTTAHSSGAYINTTAHSSGTFIKTMAGSSGTCMKTTAHSSRTYMKTPAHSSGASPKTNGTLQELTWF